MLSRLKASLIVSKDSTLIVQKGHGFDGKLVARKTLIDHAMGVSMLVVILTDQGNKNSG